MSSRAAVALAALTRVAGTAFGLSVALGSLLACGDDTRSRASAETTPGTSTDTGSSVDADTSMGATGTDSGTSTGEDTDCLQVQWYLDADGDGRGDPSMSMTACSPAAGHVGPGDDCDDTDDTVHPLADEVCDGKDNDCDGLRDEGSPANTMCNGCTPVEMEGHGYYFCPMPQVWAAARTQCMDLFAADLVKIETGTENDALVAAESPVSGGVGGWFIGLSDQTTEGTFVWTDASALEFMGWNEGEPNDSGGAEDCAEMSLETGGWNDIGCDTPRAFVCESTADG